MPAISSGHIPAYCPLFILRCLACRLCLLLNLLLALLSTLRVLTVQLSLPVGDLILNHLLTLQVLRLGHHTIALTSRYTLVPSKLRDCLRVAIPFCKTSRTDIPDVSSARTNSSIYLAVFLINGRSFSQACSDC